MDTEVLIIGAGPGGLAAAALLGKAGVEYRLIEKQNEIAYSWKNHYHRLALHTAKKESYLPGKPFSNEHPEFVPRQDFVNYLEEYAREYNIKAEFGVEVLSVEQLTDHCLVRTSSGEIQAEFVVVATGFCNKERNWKPAGFKEAEQQILKASDYRNVTTPLDLRDKRVLLIGMGNTGAEIALDLAENDVNVSLSVRGEVVRVYREFMGRPTQLSSIMLGKFPDPIAYSISSLVQKLTVKDLSEFGLRSRNISPLKQLFEEGKTPVMDLGTGEMIRNGRIRVFPGVKFLSGKEVHFTDGSMEEFDVIIPAIGYTNGLEDLIKPWPEELENDQPNIEWHYPQLPNIFFLGFDARMNGQLRGIRIQSEKLVNEIIGLKSIFK